MHFPRPYAGSCCCRIAGWSSAVSRRWRPFVASPLPASCAINRPRSTRVHNTLQAQYRINNRMPQCAASESQFACSRTPETLNVHRSGGDTHFHWLWRIELQSGARIRSISQLIKVVTHLVDPVKIVLSEPPILWHAARLSAKGLQRKPHIQLRSANSFAEGLEVNPTLLG